MPHRSAGTRPLLTVGIPTFNRCERLRRTLERLRPLLGPEVECIVVDNGSTDGTARMITDLVSKAYPLRAFRNEHNIGYDRNYLRLIEQARGTWLWPLGDDESVDFAKVQIVLEHLRASSEGALFLPPAYLTWPDAGPFCFADVEDLVQRFPVPTSAIPHMSSAVLRLEYARQAESVVRWVGLLHVQVPVLLHCVNTAGLTVLDCRVLVSEEGQAPPRWPAIEAYLGAWETLRGTVPSGVVGLIDRQESRSRTPTIVGEAMYDLLGVQVQGLSWRHAARLARLVRLQDMWRFYPLGVALLGWVWPRPIAWALVRFLVVRGRHQALSKLRLLTGAASDADLVPLISAAITARRRLNSGAAHSDY